MPGVRFSLEQKAKAVRLVAEVTPQYESQWAAIESVAAKIGASAETVRKWVRRAEIDAGQRPGIAPGDGGREQAGGRGDEDQDEKRHRSVAAVSPGALEGKHGHGTRAPGT